MKVVAVSQRIDVHVDRSERRDALDQRLVGWLLEAGYLAVPVPNALVSRTGALEEWFGAVRAEGVVLSGGGDPGKDPDRDETERWLASWAVGRGCPLLGLCRGMQMLGVIAGAQLGRVDGHVRTRHHLRGCIEGAANSYHARSLATCPDGYEVLARSDDGAIEAIRHRERAWEGWMWHPEREPVADFRDVHRLRALFG